MTESSITALLMKQITEKDQEISKLRENTQNKDGVIAELQKKLVTFDIKAPIEESTVPDAASVDITTIRRIGAKLLQRFFFSSQDPPVIQATSPVVPAPKKKNHGYTEGTIGFEWKKKRTQKGYTYWYTFIKPTVPAYTNGLNVYVSVNSHNDVVSKGRLFTSTMKKGMPSAMVRRPSSVLTTCFTPRKHFLRS